MAELPSKRRPLSWAVGLLLTTAVALNIAAISKTTWVEEQTSGIATTYPAALLHMDQTRTLTHEDLNPTSPKGFVVYEGMRAGAFQVCYTFLDVSGPSNVWTDHCFSYRSEGDHRVFQRIVTSEGESGSLYSASFSMCDLVEDTSFSFHDIGIPSEALLPAFLASFCSFQSLYLAAILPIGAIVATVASFVAWLNAYTRTAMLLASVGFLLTTATYVLWIGVSQQLANASSSNATIVQGVSAHCMIAAAVLLLVAVVTTKFSARLSSKHVPQASPSVPLV